MHLVLCVYDYCVVSVSNSCVAVVIKVLALMLKKSALIMYFGVVCVCVIVSFPVPVSSPVNLFLVGSGSMSFCILDLMARLSEINSLSESIFVEADDC